MTQLKRVVTDNDANYKARGFTHTVKALAGGTSKSGRIPRGHNGKVEQFNLLLVDEVLYARPYASEQARRRAVGVWLNHDNYRPHTACGDQPPTPRTPRPSQ